ncbi:LysM domain-containing protein [Agreia bicolorata]|uniref:LysM domain-containing protein n=1 Tax=Agreia bicolorata TaxID=110935 RepID=A0A1T4Y122_9MICO|nr:LysM domain-containing protein [Agreia bicolorata]SKA95460.1 LysM domain-containing protein [Agreia bicolorata]
MSCKRRAGALGALTALVMLLTACVPQSQTRPDATGGATAAPTGDATIASSPAPVAPGAEVASAVFTPRPGSQASGSFTVVASDEPDAYQIITHDLAAPAGSELTLLPYTIDASQPCADSGFRFSLGSVDSMDPGSQLLLPDLTQGDPSFFGSAVLTLYSDADREQNDCLATVVASAPIVWTMSPRRPDLKVADTGQTAGAAGVVAVDDSGAAISYTVAPGDTLSSIAERFGISVDDIFYLNPSRGLAPQDQSAYTGEVLNLSLTDR